MPARSNPVTFALFWSAALVVGLLVMLELGRQLGGRAARRAPGAAAGSGTVEAAVFGLLGLLIAFTFNGAGDRLDWRRRLIVDEANAIGTAYLRVDALPRDAQPSLRGALRSYVDSRLLTYRLLPDLQAAAAERTRSTTLQQTIWRQAVAGCQRPDAHASACLTLLPALNVMIDITTTRTMAGATHPPPVIYAVLFVLALCAALFAGYAMGAGRERPWLHMVGLSIILASALYVTLDLEHPRLGHVQVRAFDRALVETRAAMQ